jgi:hypothetical protein
MKSAQLSDGVTAAAAEGMRHVTELRFASRDACDELAVGGSQCDLSGDAWQDVSPADPVGKRLETATPAWPIGARYP